MPTMPPQIISEVLAEQSRLGTNYVPTYAEFKDASGREFFCRYTELTVARCEQAVEFHRRRAVSTIERFIKRPSDRTARSAAMDVVRARVFRCRYLQLTGSGEQPDEGMPFQDWQY